MRDTLVDRLGAGHVVVADGAWGTMLIARGLRPGEAPEVINLSRRDVLVEIARAYLDAGAEIVTTNTFGGSPMRLADAKLEHEVRRVNVEAVAAVREAVGDRAWISASIGPCGKLLAPLGDARPADVEASFAVQAEILAEAGVDLFCVETMTDVQEAVIAVTAVRRAAPDVPVIATMTFEPSPKGFRTVMGVSAAQAVRALTAAGAAVLGANCGTGIDAMVGVAAELRAHTALPLAVRANAGLPERRDGALVYPEPPEVFAARVPALVAAGANVIGGCCGTTPAHVRAIRAAVGIASRDA